MEKEWLSAVQCLVLWGGGGRLSQLHIHCQGLFANDADLIPDLTHSQITEFEIWLFLFFSFSICLFVCLL